MLKTPTTTILFVMVNVPLLEVEKSNKGEMRGNDTTINNGYIQK